MRDSTPDLSQGKTDRIASTGRGIVAEVVFSLLVVAFQTVQWGWGWSTLGLVCAVIAALPALLAAARKEVDPPLRANGRLLVCGCLIFAAAQLVFALAMLVKPKVFDIGETTLAAALAVMHGSNPYTAQIDTAAGGIADDDRFHGYKYLPMMIMVYAPLCLAFGMRGIIVTNILLQAMTAAVIRSIAAVSGGLSDGPARDITFINLPLVPNPIFHRCAKDIMSFLIFPLSCGCQSQRS